MIDLVPIPYKGSGPAAAAVVGGQVAMMFGGPSSVKPHVAAGKLRAIAITGEKRNAALADVPTFIESGLKGVDSGTYWSSLAPAATPRDIVNTLSGAMAKVLQAPDIRQRLVELAFEPIGSSPEALAVNLRSEMAKWGKVISAAKIRLD